MCRKKYLAFLFFIGFIAAAHGQEVLPRIKVLNYNGRIVVSWKNEYVVPVANISIQRSFDSLKNYSTIGSVLNPQNLENGYADQKPPYNKMYYRVFISFAGGKYVFSEIRRPVKDTSQAGLILGSDTIVVFQERPKGWVPSRKVFTGKDNNIIIYLPDAASRKYSLKFFDEEENPVFSLSRISEPWLTIEKVNFVHSGWFLFELYDNGELVEKNKFFVPKDGKNPTPVEQGKGF